MIVKKSGASAEEALNTQKMEKARKNKPKGIMAKAGSTNAFFSGLPLQRIFSFVFSNLSSLGKKFPLGKWVLIA